jgi:hypothetical protein
MFWRSSKSHDLASVLGLSLFARDRDVEIGDQFSAREGLRVMLVCIESRNKGGSLMDDSYSSMSVSVNPTFMSLRYSEHSFQFHVVVWQLHIIST